MFLCALAIAGCGGGGISGPVTASAATAGPGRGVTGPVPPAAAKAAGWLYLGGSGVIDVYPGDAPGDASGYATPLRSITGFERVFPGRGMHSGGTYLHSLAAQADGTISALLFWGGVDSEGRFFDLVTFAPGANGAVPPSHALESQQGLQFDIMPDGQGHVDVLRATQGWSNHDVIDTFATNVDERGPFPDATPLRRLNVTPDMSEVGRLAGDPSGRMYELTKFTTACVGIFCAESARVDVYAPGAAGNDAPVRSFTFALTDYVKSVAAGADGTFYLAEHPTSVNSEFQVLAFGPATSGTATPSRTLTGPNGGFVSPVLAVDAAGELLVLDPLSGPASVLYFFDAGASGASAPVRTTIFRQRYDCIALAAGAP